MARNVRQICIVNGGDESQLAFEEMRVKWAVLWRNEDPIREGHQYGWARDPVSAKEMNFG